MARCRKCYRLRREGEQGGEAGPPVPVTRSHGQTIVMAAGERLFLWPGSQAKANVQCEGAQYKYGCFLLPCAF